MKRVWKCLKKVMLSQWGWWLTLAILDSWEAEIRRIALQG
jgi:hypothetical protein